MEVKSKEDVQNFANKTEKELEDLKKANDEAKKAQDAKKVEDEKKFADTQKAIGDLTFLFKQNWRETDTEARKKEYFGRFVQKLMHKDSKGLVEMGAIPAADYMTKSALTGTPLRGDDSTLGGSYLIEPEYSREIIRIAAPESVMMPIVTRIPTTKRTIYMPNSTDAIAVTWVSNEVTAKTENTFTWGRTTISVNTCAAWTGITEEMQEDSIVELGGYYRGLFAEAFATEFDTQCLKANAAPFDGVLYQSSVYDKILDPGKTSFSSIEADDLLDTIAELTTANKRRGARFFLHTTILDQVKKLKDAQGNYIWMEPAGQQPATIWGYPYSEPDVMPANSESAASTAFIAFGNPKYIYWADRIPIEFRIFDNVQDTMQYDLIFLRGRVRWGLEVWPYAFSKLVTAAA